MPELARDPQKLRHHAASRAKMPLDADKAMMRFLVAEQCRLIGARLTGQITERGTTSRNGVNRASTCDMPLSPRVRQTLDRLLRGDSEKQVARRLKVSPHTVHVYVKTLYRKMNVSSRGELLAKFVTVERCN